MNTNASMPSYKRVRVKTLDRREVDSGTWRKRDAPASPVVENNTSPIYQPPQRRASVVRMETFEAKDKRLGNSKEKKAREVEDENPEEVTRSKPRGEDRRALL